MTTILECEDLTKQFGGLTALDSVDLALSDGEIVGLIGPNGAGKTTLFNCISGVYPPTRGRIQFRGTDITGQLSNRIAREGLARTFQITRPIEHLSVLENVMLAAHIQTKQRARARDIAWNALEFVDIADLARESGGELTVGHQKMVELARVVATDPTMILVDEMMAGLNPAESQRILDQLDRIHERGIGLFVIEHDMQAIMNLSDRIVVLNNGEKLTEGAPDEVAADPRVVEVYLGDADA